MASTNITAFKYLVAPDVLPCPDPMVNREVISTINEFCKKTNILQRDFELSVDSNDIDTELQNCIDFDISEYSRDLRPSSVLEMLVDSNEYIPQLRNIRNTITNWSAVSDERIKYFWIPNYHTIRVFDMSSNDNNIWMRISVKPKTTATTVDEELYENWSEAIVAGAKWRIMSMPGKEWSNPEHADYYRREYRKYLSQAKAYITRGGTGIHQESVHWKSFGE